MTGCSGQAAMMQPWTGGRHASTALLERDVRKAMACNEVQRRSCAKDRGGDGRCNRMQPNATECD
jgi:hypothetical protein